MPIACPIHARDRHSRSRHRSSYADIRIAGRGRVYPVRSGHCEPVLPACGLQIRARLDHGDLEPAVRWGETFSDDVVAAAMIDRLVHHAEVLTLTGDSYRTRARRELLAKDRAGRD